MMINSIQDSTSAYIAPAESNKMSVSSTTGKQDVAVDETSLQPDVIAGKELVDAADAAALKKAEEKDGKKLKKDDVATMTSALNDFMENLNCNLEFKYYEKLNQLSVRMVDKQTQETIKEFPPEEIMKAMVKTKEWIGVFLDKNA